MRKILISSTLGFFATLAAPAYAQDDAGELEQWQRDIDVAAEPLRGRDWHGFVGAGVVAAQRAHGDERAIVLPLASISYKDIAYWRTAGWRRMAVHRRPTPRAHRHRRQIPPRLRPRRRRRARGHERA